MNFSELDCSLIGIENISLMLQRDINLNHTLNLARSAQYILREWILYPSYSDMKMFHIPTVACFLLAFFSTPIVLLAIYSNFSLRQEARFLLLGNTLICDIIYLLFYTTITVCNALSLKTPKHVCLVFLFVMAVTYSGGVFTAAATVVDTYIAVLWPLQYVSLLSTKRTKKLIMLLWIFSFIFPAIAFLLIYLTQKPSLCPLEVCSLPLILVITLHGDETLKLSYILFIGILLLCLSLILCGYIILCYRTRDAGIWKSVSSRANITFLMHYTLLFLYFCPPLLLLTDSLLYMSNVISFSTGLWVTMTICNVLIVLPKAAHPCLYGLRYRELCNSLKLFLGLKKHREVAPTRLPL